MRVRQRIELTEKVDRIEILTAAEREGDAADQDDDSGVGLNSLLAFQAEEAGDYIVRVTSFGERDGLPTTVQLAESRAGTLLAATSKGIRRFADGS